MDLDVYLDAIVAGDDRAFSAWLAAAEPTLRASLRPFAAQVDVEAVLQEVLLRAWQLAPRVERDGRGNSLLRYAQRAGRNLAIDEVRRQRRRGEVSEEDAPGAAMPEVVAPDPRLASLIRLCLEALAGSPKVALQARLGAEGGASDHELCAAVGMKLNTFLKNVGRARRLLHDCLVSRGVEPAWGEP